MGKESLKEWIYVYVQLNKVYMYTLLYTWNEHNIVSQLYTNIQIKLKNFLKTKKMIQPFKGMKPFIGHIKRICSLNWSQTINL